MDAKLDMNVSVEMYWILESVRVTDFIVSEIIRDKATGSG